MKVAVLRGGRSLEREVSMRSGARVEDALGALGHEAIAIDPGAEPTSLRDAAPDVAFIALHGPGGEDGTVQEPSRSSASPTPAPESPPARALMDKVAAKHEMRRGHPQSRLGRVQRHGIPRAGRGDTLEEIEDRLGFPLVQRRRGRDPRSASSSPPTSRRFPPRWSRPSATTTASAGAARARPRAGRRDAGREPLPIVEAIPREEDFFNFEARYEIGRTDYTCPAELDEVESGAVRERRAANLRDARLLGVRPRRSDPGRRGPEVLEVNAIRGSPTPASSRWQPRRPGWTSSRRSSGSLSWRSSARPARPPSAPSPPWAPSRFPPRSPQAKRCRGTP